MLQRIINKYFYDYRDSKFRIQSSAFEHLLFSFQFTYESRIACLRVIHGNFDNRKCDTLKYDPSVSLMDDTERDGYYQYNWDKLRESLIKDKSTDIFHINELSDTDIKCNAYEPGYEYAAADGNHRLAILKCLYGLDHKVTIHLDPKLKKASDISLFVYLFLFIIDRYKSLKRRLRINEIKKDDPSPITYYLCDYKERLKEVKNKTYKPHDK